MKTIFLRALEVTDKEPALRTSIREPKAVLGTRRFEVDTASFASMPRSPFAYWVSEQLRHLFKELPPCETAGRTARQGLATADDFRYVRCWWEISSQQIGKQWFPFAKGGAFSPFYADVYLVVNWKDNGMDIYGYPNAAVRNPDFYYRPGLTWPRRTKSELSLRVMPRSTIFSDKGPTIFMENDTEHSLLATLSLLNSSSFRALVKVQLAAADARPGGAAHSFEVGVIQSTPVPCPTYRDGEPLASIAKRMWSLRRSLDTRTETSHAFTLPALLQVGGETLVHRSTAWVQRVRTVDVSITDLQADIDQRCFGLYGINEADRRTIIKGFATDVDEPSDADTDPDEEKESKNSIDAAALAAELVSWAVGVAFGRFDVHLATGDRPPPDEPEPFDPLPVCSPAMLTGDEGLPLASTPANYPVDFPENGILVDDPGHARDLATAVQIVFEAVFGDRVDAILRETEALLDPKGHDLRAWLASDFFEHHLKRYSKSRRKAPILWQLGVPSGRFSVWLYAHRLARDTFFQIRRDVVEPKLLYEERQLADLAEEAGARPSAKQRREIAAREEFLQELHIMLEEVKRLAPEWNPTLDDGVVLTMAPLWRLVPQHRAWQRELRSRWEELESGRYDWAHIAMRHWPERVTAKCATDRSLAIAHGLSE
jgi:hypothetical protein